MVLTKSMLLLQVELHHLRIYFSALKDHKSTLLLDLLPWRLSISISDQIYSGLFRLNFILQQDQPQSSIYHIELHSNSHLICKYKIGPQLLLSRGNKLY
ncbi:hypothetical protein ACET3Z_019624 [Daucus carota]